MVVVDRGSPRICDAICLCALICNIFVFLYLRWRLLVFLSIPRVFLQVLLGGMFPGVLVWGYQGGIMGTNWG
jgi:hypothetical protein